MGMFRYAKSYFIVGGKTNCAHFELRNIETASSINKACTFSANSNFVQRNFEYQVDYVRVVAQLRSH